MSEAAIWVRIALHWENTETALFQNHKNYFEQIIGLLAYQVEQIKTVNITATVLNW